MPAEHFKPSLSIGVVILAAGASSRMGRPKMLLPWGKTSVIGHILFQWRQLQAQQIGVVCAGDDRGLTAELDHLGHSQANRILNPAPERGMFSSVQCAAVWTGWRPDLSHWIIALGDQPHLRLPTLSILLDFGAQHPYKICQPLAEGHRRHPILFPKTSFLELPKASESDLNVFLQNRSNSVKLCRVSDEGLALDIDRPEDYEKAIELDRKQA